MTIANLLRRSFTFTLIHLTVLGAAQGSDSLPSIQALYDSTGPKSARKEALPSVKPVAAKKVRVAPKHTISQPLPIVAEWPTYFLDEALEKKQPARLVAPVKPTTPKPPAAKPRVTVKALKTPKPVASKPAPKPIVAKTGTESQHNPETAKKLDFSQLAIFGPQASSFRYDTRMVRAMDIASARAYAHSQGSCWRYVKNALLSAGLVESRPTSAYAKQAAGELTSKYGFHRISCSDPYQAPIGSVLVYGGSGAGHIEFRTRSGFVSDFTTPRPSRRPLIGVYIK